VADPYVARKCSRIGEHIVIAYDSVVTYMAHCHEEIAIADASYHPAARRARVERDTLAYRVVVADNERALFPAVLEILRRASNRGKLKKLIIIADPGIPLDHNVRAYSVIGAKHYLWPYYGVRPYRTALS